jgi:chorismate mutase
MDKKLAAYRKKIDALDDRIFDLFQKRISLVKKIWQYKKKMNYADWSDLKDCKLLDLLTVKYERRKEISSFEYEKQWL